MSVLFCFVLILVQLNHFVLSLKYDVEDTICSLCKQRKVCKPGNTPTSTPGKKRALFAAYFPRHTLVSPGQRFVLNSVTMNIGGLYNGNTGIFTSDRDGVFLFSWSVYKMKGAFFSVVLYMDGAKKAISFSGITGYETLSGSLALPLRKGNKVWLQCGPHKQGLVHALPNAYFAAVSL